MEKVRLFVQTARDKIVDYRGTKKRMLMAWYQDGEDFLFIFRDAPNKYTVQFNSHIKENSWVHYDEPLRLAIMAIASWDESDMLGCLFHDKENGTFEY